MLVAARAEGCLEQVRIIAAALSVQDPRERPLEHAAAADERHARFADEQSDFLSFLKLWKLQDEPGLRRLCRENFLSYPAHARVARRARAAQAGARLAGVLGRGPRKPEGYRAIHRALLTGLLGNVGMRDEEGAYTGARGIKFWVHPGSWTKKPGKWIVAAELVETTRLFARTVASDRAALAGGARRAPAQAQPQRSALGEGPRRRWWRSSAARSTGCRCTSNRRVPFAPFDPDLARDIFIRSALVEGDFDTRAPFFAHNRRLVADIERLEHKSRRPDILVDDELIHAFYDERIPKGINSAQTSSTGAGRPRPPSRSCCTSRART